LDVTGGLPTIAAHGSKKKLLADKRAEVAVVVVVVVVELCTASTCVEVDGAPE
jgi:hypothetical protein